MIDKSIKIEFLNFSFISLAALIADWGLAISQIIKSMILSGNSEFKVLITW